VLAEAFTFVKINSEAVIISRAVYHIPVLIERKSRDVCKMDGKFNRLFIIVQARLCFMTLQAVNTQPNHSSPGYAV